MSLKPYMGLAPIGDSNARQSIVNNLLQLDDIYGIPNRRCAEYVAKTFPSILLDVARILTEQATQGARESSADPANLIKQQLKPFLMFSSLLGKCPQITGLMYSYFENSSFQPLNNHPGLGEELWRPILITYFRYLAFNPKWFSAVWNWGQLGNLITHHPDPDIRYLAGCCLSIITQPSRKQHISIMQEIVNDDDKLIELPLRYGFIHINPFKPCIETKHQQLASEYASGFASDSSSAYSYDSISLTKLSNILLIRRDISQEKDHKTVQDQCTDLMCNYIPIPALEDSISKIAYAVSIGKPCIVRGFSGCGKTAILDYVAAHTNRVNPPHYIKVQIGDQIDSKMLIGSYVCTEIPGQFEWQPGPLTKAMTFGSWIVFEDIDLAPADMAQVIHSVLENGNLSCVSSCPIKLDSPHPDFRIFFTQQTQKNKISDNHRIGFGFVERLCDIVDLPKLSEDDLHQILVRRYNFGHLTKTILKLFNEAEESLEKGSRKLSYRDLFKYCERFKSLNITDISQKLDGPTTESMFLDAVDCFLASLSQKDLEIPTQKLGVNFSFSPSEIQRLAFRRQPEAIEETDAFKIGRVRLDYISKDPAFRSRSTLAYTRQSLQLLESVTSCIKHREPVLLVGETGVGKTSVIQYLANLVGVDMTVINLSQQSDTSDLLGGFKPIELRDIISPTYDIFDKLFRETFDVTENEKFLKHVSRCFTEARRINQWITYLNLLCNLCTRALKLKLKKRNQIEQWQELHERVKRLTRRLMQEHGTTTMALAFSEGSLLRAVREGKWVLLDEINLAEPDVLQCLLSILDSMKNSHVYMHNLNNDDEAVKIHPTFRIFACMNPSTDIGKRDLATGTRARFTEFFVDDVTETQDLRLIVESYVKSCLPPVLINKTVKFYQEIRARSGVYSDISGNIPVYSLRTLCRSLAICSLNVCRNMEKSLYESLKITFLQQLNKASVLNVMKLIESEIFDKKSIAKLEETTVQMPKDDHQYCEVEGFWIQKSNEEPVTNTKYITTPSVNRNLQSLSRIISLSQRRLPILIQGNTSVGKTSLIMYLAKLTGNRCYRINNHEHTDLQEYVGRHVLREDGELEWKDGLLVHAMKKGYWIILDELNLAPTELLEALNRVLDDNRELFIPEKGETIKAHSKFVLFATQNPPEEYAGRKLLSRAFRNRFVELHFDEIPRDELEVILERRCEMPPKYAQKIVAVMKELQMCRRESGCFNGKSGFMTLRDLFRWGERYACYKQTISDNQFTHWEYYLASEGLILLEGKVRTYSEADTVKKTIEKVFNCILVREKIYHQKIYDSSNFQTQFKHIHFSPEFQKLYVQLTNALLYKEPVLLCGQTGCGKTTACQLYSSLESRELISYNCHLNTESADFVGGVRPSRQEDNSESSTKQTFPWVDGPLVQAMKKGAIFLMDEISLADDAVLERINSVLEPRRSITLTEHDGNEIFANEKFRFVATMNPGGDYGKKELSPALRNRFTEIYCHNTTDINQIREIVQACLSPALLKPKFAPKLLQVVQDFLQQYYKQHSCISIRDVLSWTQFLNKIIEHNRVALDNDRKPVSIQEAIMHGASLVFFDQIGTCGYRSFGITDTGCDQAHLRKFLKRLVDEKFGKTPLISQPQIACDMINEQDVAFFSKFHVIKGPNPIYEKTKREFVRDVPIVKKNILKIVRAMQLDRPILLEGSPGSGKTSVVTALAALTGHNLVRINLSEQTDISDLFGSDLPSESSESDNPSFCWHDGPMLKAIKDNSWILLDEMNLASQSVLEGLNACFDHRGEMFISELNKTIVVNRSKSRIFACQNPYSQGAARKGLPQSFLNRFTSIYIESHSLTDLAMILHNLHSSLPIDLVDKMVNFNYKISNMSPYSHFEFNLRDLLYWSELITANVKGKDYKKLNLYRPDKFVQFVYIDRLRSTAQKQEVSEIFETTFGYPVYEPPYREVRIGERSFMMTRSILPRKTRLSPHLSELCILKFQMPFLESIAKAIEHNKMPILVGETGVGKRSMIRILAGLTGSELNIIGANRDMDTLELLGSYEQKNLQREVVDLVEYAKDCIQSLINSTSPKYGAEGWEHCFNHIWQALYATSIRDFKLSQTRMLDAYQAQLVQMKELIEKLEPIHSNDKKKRLSSLKKRINNLLQRFLDLNGNMCSSGNFEWIDSILIKSIKQGHWLMIENANLLNPATLDRLNSLVEPNGSLALNEKGSGAKGIEVLKPHPDFRLILTMNPDYGELSRAMRNRGVEIFVQSGFFYEDFLMLLNQNGFEPEEKKACMTYCIMQTSCDVHQMITGEAAEEDGSLLAYFGLNYITTLTNQIRRGVDVNLVLADLLVSFYSQRGYGAVIEKEDVFKFVDDKMVEYSKLYEVKLLDERYKWRHLVHDLFAMSGGDAIPAMLDRDSRIFYEDLNIELLLKPDEVVDNIDIVNTCIQVKLFLELSTHGDFEYRRAVIKETFRNFDKMLAIVDKHVNLLKTEYIPFMNKLMPESELLLASDMQVDTRHTPDVHYYLQCLDYEGTSKREKLQNRWFLTLHRIMLRMIVEMVEDRSLEMINAKSLWEQSEAVRTNTMPKENLIRPCAAIASDLYDLLDGLMRVVSERCFDDDMVSKMLPRFFWLSYFICKLKRSYPREEAIAVCNEIPMLWALTCQKIIAPMNNDCGLGDLVYINKKFSSRIRSICEALDVTLAKPGPIEKAYYKKVLNMYATTTKLCEVFSREVDKFFGTLVGRYTTKSKAFSLGSDNEDTLAASGYIWSNTTYMESFYELEDKLLLLDVPYGTCNMNEDEGAARSELELLLNTRKDEYNLHEKNLLLGESYKIRCLSDNRMRSALDQFAPIWQMEFLRARLSRLTVPLENAEIQLNLLRRIIKNINGLILSPSYYSAVTKLFNTLDRNSQDLNTSMTKIVTPREYLDMYTSFLADHLVENGIFDHQIVGWTKLRVTTCNSAAIVPLIPEYSPIVSLVSGYCLDFAHLKVNSYLNSNTQLLSLLRFLWKQYTTIKLNTFKDQQDIDLIRNLLHLRIKIDNEQELVGTYKCSQKECLCIEKYIEKRLGAFRDTLTNIDTQMRVEDREVIKKSVKMIYFGYLNYLEYAPLFTLDPSLKSREKLEIYKAELAHIKLDLNLRNTLYYWKTGENLQLNDIDNEEASLYTFSTRVLVERRVKLEKSIAKLSNKHTNRPKTDDGSLYYDLRKDVEINMIRYNNYIQLLMNELIAYIKCNNKTKSNKLMNLITKCRMFIKNIERSIIRLRSEYALYKDLTTSFLVGLGLVHQGVRCLYARLEQKLQIVELGFGDSTSQFSEHIRRVFSFNDFNQNDLTSVHNKLDIFSRLEKVCPQESVSNIRSILLRTILIQLNHHITITPSDIKKCMPIVRHIANLFHAAWLKRKLYYEELRKQKEELYKYKPSRSTLGTEITYERQEFLDLCIKFPTYDHVYKEDINIEPTEAEKENLSTEEKLVALNQNVDLSLCIDICKAHYKFTKEASLNLLGQIDSSKPSMPPRIDMSDKIKLESQTLYTLFRSCVSNFDQTFDSYSVECHLLQADELLKTLQQSKKNINTVGSLKSSIEILDEEIFDIYHNSSPHEVLRFHDYISKLTNKVIQLRSKESRDYINHSILTSITKLTTRISSFLISDPLMKFITGSHTLLSKIEEWNSQSIPKADKLIAEGDQLIDLITSWRKLEGESWISSLHKVKRKYIDSTLCDLWFRLYEMFNNPIVSVRNFMAQGRVDKAYTLKPEEEIVFYIGFAWMIIEFLEDSTLGDHQLRLDLVFSFAIQTRFASLHEEAQPNYLKDAIGEEKLIKIDFEKLSSYVYNVFRQYQGIFEPIRGTLELEEASLTKELRTEIRIVAWQGRNLWDIKNNYRISHRKLNKVMNKYLEVLKRPSPPANPKTNIRDILSKSQSQLEVESQKMSATLAGIHTLITGIESPTTSERLTLLEATTDAPKLVSELKENYYSLNEPMNSKYVENLYVLECAIDNNTGEMKKFFSQDPKVIKILPTDSKEMRQEKQKQARQMHNIMRVSVQSIFKELQNIGVSYQRGLNSESQLDPQILSLEPLRGMIQNQSRLVLEGASMLVDEKDILFCNEQYRKLISGHMFLNDYLKQAVRLDLSPEQMSRIKGCSIDLSLDIIRTKRSAAYIYRHMMDIQAISTRLNHLKKNFKNETIIVYKFHKVHTAIEQFNELVGRAYLSIIKLQRLVECYKTIQNYQNEKVDSETDTEEKVLNDLIDEMPNETSLMTENQLEHFNSNFGVLATIAKISNKLKDMLNYTIRNHLYSDLDKQELIILYKEFLESFSKLVNIETEPTVNMTNTTILASMIAIHEEIRIKLKQTLDETFQDPSNQKLLDVRDHPNVKRLNMRLIKLTKKLSTACQNVYKAEMEPIQPCKLKTKPLSFLDSVEICKLLRLSSIAKLAGDCFVTLNYEEKMVDISPIVMALTPQLFIYTQTIAIYLNIILTSLRLKLINANQLIPFFTELVVSGFGAPMELLEQEPGEGQMMSTGTDDNTGFGEGQGETDVSKKLELESQLDDLKTSGDSEEKKDENQEEPVEAHDDGVEMTDDFDAKAQGADGEETNSDDKDENKKDEENYDDLDKELDEVDQEEDRLDEKLADIEQEEDDEQDLRDAEAEASSKSKGKPEVSAKENNSSEAKENDDEDTNQTAAEGEENKKSDQLNELDDDQNEELDIEDEASLALKEAQQTMDAENLEESETNEDKDKTQKEEDVIDMDLESDEEGNEEKNNEDDEREKNEKEDPEEGEIESDAEDKMIDEEGTSSSQNIINDSDIDHQLEVAIRPKVSTEALADPVEETIKSSSANAQQESSDVQEKEMESQEIRGKNGTHRMYQIFDEEDDDPLDCGNEDDDESKVNQNDEQVLTEDLEQSANDQISSLRQSMFVDDEKDEEDESQPKKNDKEKDSSSKSSKRTFAQRRDQEEENEIKRQKISKASEKTKAEQDKQKDQQQKKPASKQVRHIDKDVGGDAPEVIDLISSSDDDECFETPFDSNAECSSKPTEDKQKEQNKKVELEEETVDVENTTQDQEREDDKVMEVENGEEKDGDTSSVYDDPLNVCTSPISSIESGELVEENSQPESFLPDDPRATTTYNTNLGLLKFISLDEETGNKKNDTSNIMQQIDNELSRKTQGEHDSVITDQLTGLWTDCTRQTGHLVQELCQQLQIVLQPTKMSKYKGDYKTGKRLNMRKIISYIASHYRRDKIWLRRTKPSKRTYNITIAVDNSSSMSENNCRQMTYQSLALLAKSLSLIEAGSLSVVSFGEKVNCVHGFSEPYSEAVGAQWLRALRFNEKQTSYKQLLSESCVSFAQQAQYSAATKSTSSVSQLLIIISDGRNVSREEDDLKVHLRQLKSMGVLTLFIIIDDLRKNENSSIVDVTRVQGLGANVKIVKYMELFPFPFYVILRRLETMPSVLGEALRQWFELVSNS